jgi:hypothetical protein
MSNVDIILKMYEYFGQGDLAKIRSEVLHPEIVWKLPGHHPLAGEAVGPDQVMGFLGSMAKSGIAFENIHFGQLDNGTVVEAHVGRGTLGSEEYVFPAAVTYEIVDGKIHRVQVHSADQHALDRYLWAQFSLAQLPDRLVQQ